MKAVAAQVAAVTEIAVGVLVVATAGVARARIPPVAAPVAVATEIAAAATAAEIAAVAPVAAATEIAAAAAAVVSAASADQWDLERAAPEDLEVPVVPVAVPPSAAKAALTLARRNAAGNPFPLSVLTMLDN